MSCPKAGFAIALIAVLCLASMADGKVRLNPRHSQGHVSFRLRPGHGCANVDPTTIVIRLQGTSAETKNTTGSNCHRFPNDAFDRGRAWTQQGSRGKSVFAPHFDVGFYNLHFGVLRDDRVRLHGSLRVRAFHPRSTEYDIGFERYCIPQGAVIHTEDGVRYCKRRDRIDYYIVTSAQHGPRPGGGF